MLYNPLQINTFAKTKQVLITFQRKNEHELAQKRFDLILRRISSDWLKKNHYRKRGRNEFANGPSSGTLYAKIR